MNCSVLFRFFSYIKPFRRTACLILAAYLAAAVCFCVSAPAVFAGNDRLSPSVDSVNLRQDKWIYSIYTDKDMNCYSAVTRYDGDEVNIEIPSELGGIPVKVISREAFCNRKYITSVIIPDGVTEIGKYAFSGCVGLNSISFPATLRSVWDGAFYGCRSIEEIVFPEGMEEVGSFAFYNCRYLHTVVFPDSLKRIGDSSFDGCGMLQSAVFGKSLERIGDTAFKDCASLVSMDISGISELGAGAFMKCTSLESVAMGDAMSYICPETFRGCGNLDKVTFGACISSIGKSAFEGCASLKNLPEIGSLTEICPLAFNGCVSLKKAEIGENVQTIANSAFAGCASLSKISVSEGNKAYSSVNGCLYSGDGARLILCPMGYKGTLKLPESVKEIGDYAAVGCRGISDAAMNEGLDSIGKAAFLGCTDLSSLSLPDSLENISPAALGMYLYDGSVKKEQYLRVFASGGGCAEKYCADRMLPFTPYEDTFFLSSERVVLAEKKTFTLKCGFISRKKAKIIWESSDESVVKVSDGKLTALSRGNAEVTVSAEGIGSRKVNVSVVSPDEIGKSSEKTFDTRFVYCGESVELSSIFSQIIDPIFSADRFWYSSAPSVASVTNDGRVTGHCRGTANITCRMPDGAENNVLVTVTQKPAEFVLTAPENELSVGESAAAGRTFFPSYSADGITWESDDESVATVDENGLITAVGQGQCAVTATAKSGLKSSVTLNCVIPAESISLNKEERNVYQGKQFNLKVSVTPENSKQKITWRSSDPSVASVNSKGKVTGKSFGSAVIYAENAGGLSAECRVNVITRAEELSLDVKNIKINQGTTYKLNAILRPSYSPETTDTCTWNSTNEKVATVDENGLITAVGAGKCIINCRTSGDLISKCQVQVRLPAESVAIESERESIYIGDVIPLKATVTPDDSTDKIEWLSDYEEIARVSSGGFVKGIAPGKAVITARLTNDVTGESVLSSIEITVIKKAESVRLDKTSLSMIVGENDSVAFTMFPDDSNDILRWYSTDENIAKVREDGLITAVSAGSCYICIETGSGASAKCKVTVNQMEKNT